jgi:hypothetical protein
MLGVALRARLGVQWAAPDVGARRIAVIQPLCLRFAELRYRLWIGIAIVCAGLSAQGRYELFIDAVHWRIASLNRTGKAILLIGWAARSA